MNKITRYLEERAEKKRIKGIHIDFYNLVIGYPRGELSIIGKSLIYDKSNQKNWINMIADESEVREIFEFIYGVLSDCEAVLKQDIQIIITELNFHVFRKLDKHYNVHRSRFRDSIFKLDSFASGFNEIFSQYSLNFEDVYFKFRRNKLEDLEGLYSIQNRFNKVISDFFVLLIEEFKFYIGSMIELNDYFVKRKIEAQTEAQIKAAKWDAKIDFEHGLRNFVAFVFQTFIKTDKLPKTKAQWRILFKLSYFRKENIDHEILINTAEEFVNNVEKGIDLLENPCNINCYQCIDRDASLMMKNPVKLMLLAYRDIIGKCEICKNSIFEEELTEACYNCETVFHYREIAEWTKINGKCPVCKKPMKITVK